MRRFINRTAAWALSFVLTGAVGVMPSAASDHKSPAPARSATSSGLTQLSPASQRLLARTSPAPQQQPPASAPSAPGSFFKSKRGAATLALMVAGTSFALWSIQHDRKPVKSPVR